MFKRVYSGSFTFFHFNLCSYVVIFSTGGTPKKKLDCPRGSKWTCVNESKCIDLKKLCDGKRDCIDGGDEGPGCKDYQCRTMNGGCSHKCFVAPGGMFILFSSACSLVLFRLILLCPGDKPYPVDRSYIVQEELDR